MKYEILDKDALGVIFSSGGKLYRAEFPTKEIKTIGMATSRVVTYIEWEVGEWIDKMGETPIEEFVASANEVSQFIDSVGKINYQYKNVFTPKNFCITGVANILNSNTFSPFKIV